MLETETGLRQLFRQPHHKCKHAIISKDPLYIVIIIVDRFLSANQNRDSRSGQCNLVLILNARLSSINVLLHFKHIVSIFDMKIAIIN